jgi:predicted DNA-binding transcriptional regulator AlpA
MQSPDDKTPRLYVRARRLADMLDISPATVWRWVATKRLPPPRKLGPGVTAFDLAEVQRALRTGAQQ